MSTTKTGPPKALHTHAKPRRTDEAALRWEISDAWNTYLARLARCGADDAEGCRLLDAMAAAATDLRAAVERRIGVI